MKFKVYAIQGMEFETLVLDADSKEEAIATYNKQWDGIRVASVDYRPDKIEYVSRLGRSSSFSAAWLSGPPGDQEQRNYR